MGAREESSQWVVGGLSGCSWLCRTQLGQQFLTLIKQFFSLRETVIAPRHCRRRHPPCDNTLNGWEKVEVHFHSFPDLPAAQGDSVDSPEFYCFGCKWKLELYPGGNDDGAPTLPLRMLLKLSRPLPNSICRNESGRS